MLVSVSSICHPAGMGKKRGFLLGVLFVALAGGLVWMLSRPAEPAYQGKPLSAWLNEIDVDAYPANTNQAAFVAFREMGTNAIPALLKIIESRDPPFQRLMGQLNRMQSLVQFPVREEWPQRAAAPFALYAMGAKAKPAFQALTNMLLHSSTVGALRSESCRPRADRPAERSELERPPRSRESVGRFACRAGAGRTGTDERFCRQ